MEEDNNQQIILVKDDEINIDIESIEIQIMQLNERMINYVYENKDNDPFDIYTPGKYIDRVIQSGAIGLTQTKSITFYFDSIGDLEQAKRNYSEISCKIFFCLKNEVSNRIQNIVDRNIVKSDLKLNPNMVQKRKFRIKRKQNRIKAKLSANHTEYNMGFDVQNIDNIPINYLCLLCGFILQNPVQFTTCGHRACRACIENYMSDTFICPDCDEEVSKNDVMLDKGFQSEIQTLIITCLYCSWKNPLKDYEDHLQLCHADPIVSCPLESFGCSHMTRRSQISNHYLTEEHQHALTKSINQYKNSLKTDNIQTQELNEVVNVLSNGIEALNEDTQRLNTESIELENTLNTLQRDCASIKLQTDQQNQFHNIESLLELDTLLKQIRDYDRSPTSYDGTLFWRIDNFHEKMLDAQFERQVSIYSPPFYTSPTGYKMRLRLHLNGDGNARQTHVSIFFFILRGENDSVLPWPFKYKVPFCLYDQTPAQNHIIDSFRPDLKSTSFQRPHSDMNIASGIPKFCSLEIIQQENNPYVQEDTIFIQVMVDFNNMPDNILRYAFNFDPGIPWPIRYQMIQEKLTNNT